MFEQIKGWENTYLVSIHNLFINLSILMANKVYRYLILINCFFDESLNLESVWDLYCEQWSLTFLIQRLETFFTLVSFFYIF